MLSEASRRIPGAESRLRMSTHNAGSGNRKEKGRSGPSIPLLTTDLPNTPSREPADQIGIHNPVVVHRRGAQKDNLGGPSYRAEFLPTQPPQLQQRDHSRGSRRQSSQTRAPSPIEKRGNQEDGKGSLKRIPDLQRWVGQIQAVFCGKAPKGKRDRIPLPRSFLHVQKPAQDSLKPSPEPPKEKWHPQKKIEKLAGRPTHFSAALGALSIHSSKTTLPLISPPAPASSSC